MLSKLIPVFVAVSLASVGTAHAITFTLDDVLPTVERPLVGFVDVPFTGTVTIDQGYELLSVAASALYRAPGTAAEVLENPFPTLTFNLTGVLFTVRVTSTDELGTYNLRVGGADPATITYSECPIGGGFCQSASSIFGVDVVAPRVPEPATFALLLFGGGAAAWRRRR